MRVSFASTVSTSHSTVSAETAARRSTRARSSVSPPAIAIRSATMRAGSSAMPASCWNRLPAAGTEPVESEELPPGRSCFSITATLAPASCAAMAAARPQAPAPITRMSSSSLTVPPRRSSRSRNPATVLCKSRSSSSALRTIRSRTAAIRGYARLVSASLASIVSVSKG